MDLIVKYLRKMQKNSNEPRIRANLNNYHVDIVKSIPYMDDGKEEHRMDIYRPKHMEGKLPVIIEVHGGAYVSCYKEVNQQHGTYLASKGFCVVNMNYTLYPEADLTHMVKEVCAVLNWVHTNASKYGFDTEHVCLTGDSAGGHVVLMAAAALNDVEIAQSYEIPEMKQKVYKYALSCPMGSLEDLRNPKGGLFQILKIIFKKVLKDAAYMKKIDYHWYMTKHFPEVFILTTPMDALLYEHTRAMHTYMEANGINHVYKEYSQKENNLEHVFNVLYPDYAESMAANDDMVTYLMQ